MRYAIFTDIHANLEALEAVLAKIDELAQEEPINALWFLGDLVGYGPNPNECIETLRTRTDVILAGNHDWAAIGKLDLDDFSPIARISAEWTTKQLTEEHSNFLKNMPERIVLEDCTLVHGSPYGPLWEYLTSEALAERSFQYYNTRYCFVGHTHVPIIFQQQDTFSNAPTVPLSHAENSTGEIDEDEETQKLAAVRPVANHAQTATSGEKLSPVASLQTVSEDAKQQAHDATSPVETSANRLDEVNTTGQEQTQSVASTTGENQLAAHNDDSDVHAQNGNNQASSDELLREVSDEASEEIVAATETHMDDEVEELLALLGLSQSMVKVTNEMVVPPLGNWNAPDDYRAIVNPGGVGQPRDGNPQAAFMIYDTEKGFTFYRIPYDYEKTQQKIIEAGLPPYLAARLAYGR